jgi:nucleotide-binding universal stress UspA family protein
VAVYLDAVVPVDGSQLAEHALPWALAVTGPSGALHLIHVNEYATPTEVEGMAVIGPPLH